MEGIFLANGILAQVLFDYGTSHSFVAYDFVTSLKLVHEVLRRLLEIASPVSRALVRHAIELRFILTIPSLLLTWWFCT